MDPITLSCRKLHQINMQDEMQMRISRMDHGVMNSLFGFEVGILFLFGCGKPCLLAVGSFFLCIVPIMLHATKKKKQKIEENPKH
jgi:hypothetical protein